MSPQNNLITKIVALDDQACRAADLPDVDAPRMELLRAIREWGMALDRRPRDLPNEETPKAVAIERQIKALHLFVESDRRVNPRVEDRRVSTTACGRGSVPPLNWPHWP